MSSYGFRGEDVGGTGCSFGEFVKSVMVLKCLDVFMNFRLKGNFYDKIIKTYLDRSRTNITFQD